MPTVASRDDCQTCQNQSRCGDAFAQPNYCPAHAGGKSWLRYTPIHRLAAKLSDACPVCGYLESHAAYCIRASQMLQEGVGITRPALAPLPHGSKVISIPFGLKEYWA